MRVALVFSYLCSYSVVAGSIWTSLCKAAHFKPCSEEDSQGLCNRWHFWLCGASAASELVCSHIMLGFRKCWAPSTLTEIRGNCRCSALQNTRPKWISSGVVAEHLPVSETALALFWGLLLRQGSYKLATTTSVPASFRLGYVLVSCDRWSCLLFSITSCDPRFCHHLMQDFN